MFTLFFLLKLTRKNMQCQAPGTEHQERTGYVVRLQSEQQQQVPM